MRLRHIVLLLAMLVGLTGCGLHIPSDPDGTLDRAAGGVLTVGVSHQPPWTDITEAEDPAGLEPELLRDFADSIEAELIWHIGGEEQLMDLLHQGELDLVIGGLTDQSPWTSQAALTTSYTETPGADGAPEKHVMAVRMGENRFMVELERFLLSQDVRL